MGWLQRFAQGYSAHKSSKLAAIVSTLCVSSLGLTLITGEAPAKAPLRSGSSKLSITTVTPGAGTTVSGSITWQVDVSGGTPARVSFTVDGSTKWTQTTSPYLYGGATAGLDTATLSNGSHTLTATAYPHGKGPSVTATIGVLVSDNVATAPTWSVPPSVSGTALIGQTLTSSTGTWSGTSPITYSYQWLRCDPPGSSCASISGATASSYVVSSADQGFTLRSQVTAANSAGSAAEVSTPTAVVTTSSTTTTPDPGWTNVVDDQFNSGGIPSYWHSYTGFYSAHPAGSATPNCVGPSQATVSDGYLHLLMQWKTGTCGGSAFTGWWTAGLSLGNGIVPSSNSARVTLRWRVVSNGVVSHRVIPMRWPDQGNGTYGEQDWCEGSSLTTCTSFLHYGQGTSDSQIYSHYNVDLSQWHTWRFVQNGAVASAFIDDMTTPVWVCNGSTSPACNTTTIQQTLKHVVLQQECAGVGQACPSDTSGTEDIQVDWITVDNAS